MLCYERGSWKSERSNKRYRLCGIKRKEFRRNNFRHMSVELLPRFIPKAHSGLFAVPSRDWLALREEVISFPSDVSSKASEGVLHAKTGAETWRVNLLQNRPTACRDRNVFCMNVVCSCNFVYLDCGCGCVWGKKVVGIIDFLMDEFDYCGRFGFGDISRFFRFVPRIRAS